MQKQFTEKEVLEKLDSTWDQIVEYRKNSIITREQAKQRQIALCQVAGFFNLTSEFIKK